MISLKRVFVSIFFLIFGYNFLYAQTNIAITIDDVPNTIKFQLDDYNSILLNELDSLNIPITIFVNEGLIYKTDSVSKNIKLLDSWAQKKYITLGNHTFSHSRYSEVDYNVFKEDIIKGEQILPGLATKYQKSLKHFRFPYNDLGKDSLQHHKIDSFLQSKDYCISPFTVESSDWMFNYVYEYYLSCSELDKANEIGELYVNSTIEYIHFFDSLSFEKYNRKVNQIYLCHDNSLNAVYLSKIINILNTEGFIFISLDEAVNDKVYKQNNKYYKKWGVSWLYRWMPTQKERVKWMKLEPDISYVEFLFDKLSNTK